MKSLAIAAVVAAGLVATSAHAAPDAAKVKELLNKNACLGCHAVDHKVVGPAYKDVAAKYKGQNVTDKLVTKVRNGGAGVWGPVAMPANKGISEADTKLVVEWILAGAK